MAYDPEFSLFVGDLGYEVDDATLEGMFRSYYPSTRSAKVMVDPQTGRSRGFGFVRFTTEVERDRAITEMNGVYIGSKPVRVSHATARPAAGARGGAGGMGMPPPPYGGGGPAGLGGFPPQPAAAVPAPTGGGGGGTSGDADPANTTLFVGGLSGAVSEGELHAAFAACGEIVYTKIPPGKGCGFVQFVQRQAAEYALEQMNGYVIGGMPIRVSWGKSSRPPGPGMHLGGAPHAPAAHAPAVAGGGYAGYYGGGAGGYDAYYGTAYAYDASGTGAAYGAAGGYGGYGGAYAHDPAYASYGYGSTTQGTPMASPGSAAGGGSSAAGGGPAYDPLAPINVEKLNMAYMQRHIPVLTGHYVRVPIAMPVQHM